MKYIILTFTMEGVSGAPSYVNNKVKWLNGRGIGTVAFDHYGSLNLNGKIVLENLLPYKQNRMLELFFPPSYFTRRQRTRIIDRLCNAIGEANDYVVESNSTRLALWGELLAKQLNAKHIILQVSEHLCIRSEEEFHFLEFKLNRRELFTIKPKIMQNLFEGYKDISDEDANNLFFSASMGVKAEDVPLPELDGLPEAEYKILSFGRYKPYFDNMIKGIVEFSRKHEDKRVNFLIMGDVSLPSKSSKILESVENLFVKYIPSKRPVPKAVFNYSDMVIATAGCANISYRQGTKTVSMDVETNLPLGVMGYTTLDSVCSTDSNQPRYDLCELLEAILIRHYYDGKQILKKVSSGKGYDFQWGLINSDRQYWTEVNKISMDNSKFRCLIQKIVLQCGGVWLFANK